jgi:hypothetical protein
MSKSIICGEDKGFSNARGEEVEELILNLPDPIHGEMIPHQ